MQTDLEEELLPTLTKQDERKLGEAFYESHRKFSIFIAFQPYLYFNDTYCTNLQTHMIVQLKKKMPNIRYLLSAIGKSVPLISTTRPKKEIFNAV